MHKITVVVVCMVWLSGIALAEEAPGTVSEPVRTGCGLFGLSVSAMTDSNWAATHSPQLRANVGELYDAGTSMRDVRNYLAYCLVTGAGGSLAGAIASGIYDSHSANQNGAYYAFSLAATGLGIASLVYFIKTWEKTGEAGDHLHRAALGWSKINPTGGPSKPQPEK